MVVAWFLKRFAGGPGSSGLFAYLSRRDDNKTRIELEKARGAVVKDIIGQLPDGAVFRESTGNGWREIYMPPSQASPLFFFRADDHEPEQDPIMPTEFSARPPKALNSDDEAEEEDSPQQ